ncbi:ComEA family DNA-binding protein [Negadavirga shengliensis]|uniref:ComEA family DNA-binding protein n=1 Tax=Negadavirga shengliensis TaxID=1389218 RepID=A0ABV9T4L4_9BACT
MKYKVFYFFKVYLGFTQRETRGFLMVLPALGFLYVFPFLVDWWLLSRSEQDYEMYVAEAAALLEPETKAYSTHQVSGHFNEPPVLSSGQDSVKIKSSGLRKREAPELNTVYFHEVDSTLLQMVPGIGPVLSARIVDFREKVGGFYTEEQLLEVYGINSELAEKIYAQFPFDKPALRKIQINNTDFRSLVAHPYIKTGEARVIIAYRDQHGPYQDPEDLLKIKIFNQPWVDRLSPYLDF